MNHHSHLMHFSHQLATIDPLAFAGFAAIFSYSFLVSIHCFAMCGPLACSVLGQTREALLLRTILYNLGRVISYAAAGASIGLLSERVSDWSLAFGRFLSLALGVILIAFASWPLLERFTGPFAAGPSKIRPVQIKIHRFVSSLPLIAQALALGLFTVFLPCMSLHPLLLAAAATQSASHGAMTLLAFALGTLPAMLTATYVPSFVGRLWPVRSVQLLGRIFLALAGMITIWRVFS